MIRLIKLGRLVFSTLTAIDEPSAFYNSMKLCNKCKEVKEFSEFGNNKNHKDGKQYYCKPCVKKDWEAKRDHYLTKAKEYYEANKDRALEQSRKNYQEKRDHYLEASRMRYQENKERILAYSKKKRPEINKKYRERYNNDPIMKVKTLVTSRVSRYLKVALDGKYKKNKQMEEILGCTFPEFMKYIESQFQEGMSWDNHGYYGWHLDHHRPISLAKTKEELFELSHYSNYKPLWMKDNLKKSNKIVE